MQTLAVEWDDRDIVIDEDQRVYFDELDFGRYLYYADRLEKEQDAWEN